MDPETKQFIKITLGKSTRPKGDIIADMDSWGWFDTQEAWDQAVKEGLIKPLDEHYWIWHENYEKERWIQHEMEEYKGIGRAQAEANYYRWTQ